MKVVLGSREVSGSRPLMPDRNMRVQIRITDDKGNEKPLRGGSFSMKEGDFQDKDKVLRQVNMVINRLVRNPGRVDIENEGASGDRVGAYTLLFDGKVVGYLGEV